MHLPPATSSLCFYAGAQHPQPPSQTSASPAGGVRGLRAERATMPGWGKPHAVSVQKPGTCNNGEVHAAVGASWDYTRRDNGVAKAGVRALAAPRGSSPQ